MKRKVAILSVVIIALSLIAYGTVAYFSTTGTAHNVMTMGNVRIDLADKTIVGEAEKDFNEIYPNGMPVMPSTEASKLVYVTNTGNNPCYVRVRVYKEVIPADEGSQLDTGYIGIDFDTDHWVDGQDGYWYYKTALASGFQTEKLFSTVTFDRAMGNDYMNCTFNIIVSAQAVQSSNNAFDSEAGASVLDVVGWPVDYK